MSASVVDYLFCESCHFDSCIILCIGITMICPHEIRLNVKILNNINAFDYVSKELEEGNVIRYLQKDPSASNCC